MQLIRKYWSTQKKASCSAPLQITNPPWADLGSKPRCPQWEDKPYPGQGVSIMVNNNNNNNNYIINEMCVKWKQKAAQVIPIVISMAVIPKSLSQSLTTLNLQPNTYIQLQQCVILDTLFNCKKLFKLKVRPPSLILLITASQDRWIFPRQSWEVRNSIMIMILIIIIIIIIIINHLQRHLHRSCQFFPSCYSL